MFVNRIKQNSMKFLVKFFIVCLKMFPSKKHESVLRFSRLFLLHKFYFSRLLFFISLFVSLF